MIQYLSNVTYYIGEYFRFYKCTAQAQILSAFAEKDKKIAELESEILSLRQDKAIVDNYVTELEAQVEKGMCCGNCKWYRHS